MSPKVNKNSGLVATGIIATGIFATTQPDWANGLVPPLNQDVATPTESALHQSRTNLAALGHSYAPFDDGVAVSSAVTTTVDDQAGQPIGTLSPRSVTIFRSGQEPEVLLNTPSHPRHDLVVLAQADGHLHSFGKIEGFLANSPTADAAEDSYVGHARLNKEGQWELLGKAAAEGREPKVLGSLSTGKQIIVFGDFDSFNGVDSSNVIIFNVGDETYQPILNIDNPITSATILGTDIFLSEEAGPKSAEIHAYSAGMVAKKYTVEVTGVVAAMTTFDGRVIFGGAISSADGVGLENVGALNPDSGEVLPLGSLPKSDHRLRGMPVESLAVVPFEAHLLNSEGTPEAKLVKEEILFAGGANDFVLAEWDGATWSKVPTRGWHNAHLNNAHLNNTSGREQPMLFELSEVTSLVPVPSNINPKLLVQGSVLLEDSSNSRTRVTIFTEIDPVPLRSGNR